MDVAVILANRGARHFLRQVRLADELGFAAVCVGDTPVNADVFVTLAAATGVVEQAELGPLVTSTVARHPTSVAASMAALADLAPAGVFLGIGTGDSSARHVGRPPTPVRELAELIPPLRAMIAGDVAQLAGHEVKQWGIGHAPPVVVAADGPRARRVAARFADAVLLGSGLSTDVLPAAISEIFEEAEAAGRQDPPAVWVMARTSIAGNSGAAADAVLPVISVAANHTFASRAGLASVPATLRPAATQYAEAYDYRAHGSERLPDGTANPNVARLRESGLHAYVLERFAVVGDATTVADRFRELAHLGVERVVAPQVIGDVEHSLRSLAEAVALITP